MKKRLTSLASSLALVAALALAPRAYAMPEHVMYYTVYHSCIPGLGLLIGEWMVTCNGTWYGWGERPYTQCAMDVVEEVGEDC